MTCFPDEVNWNNKEFTKEMLDYLRAVYCVHPMVLDALDYINSLESRIAELEAERHWIPVSEPPKVSGKYLLLNIYDDVYPCDFIAGTEIWVLPDYDTVTHWMPLPKLPEVK